MNHPIQLTGVLGAVLALTLVGPAHPVLAADDPHAGPAMNFHAIDERLLTGGHFTDGGAERLAEAGVEVVIDLRDEPPEGQRERLAALGMEWVNVPVVWEAPTQADFDAFAERMKQYESRKVLVQCQANYRASAMTYLYRVKVAGVPADEAAGDLEAVWVPEGRWRDFMDEVLE